MHWLSGWEYRRTLTIDSGKVDDTLTNFPILIHLSNGSGINGLDVTSIFDLLGANSLKIAVTDKDNTELYVEVELWDNSNNEAWLWVKVPSISSSVDTTLYLYYDLDHADNTTYVGVTGSAVAENVWDSNFKLVCHMNDNPDTSNVMDSTSNDNDGVKKGVNEPIEATGKIGKAQDFDNTNSEYIKILDSPSLQITGDGTWEFWVQLDSFPALVSSFFEKTYAREFSIHCYNNGRLAFAHGNAGGSEEKNVLPAGSLTTGSMIHITVVRDMTAMTVTAYKNGVAGTPQVITKTPIASASDVYIGMEDAAYWAHDGKLDEVRASKDIARSSAWVGASYQTQSDNILQFGNERTVEGLSIVLGKEWVYYMGRGDQ